MSRCDARLPWCATSLGTRERRPGTPRSGRHCVHDSGDDDRLAQDVTSVDGCFLDDGHFLGRHIQAQVAPAEQNRICLLCYTLKVDQGLPVLHLQSCNIRALAVLLQLDLRRKALFPRQQESQMKAWRSKSKSKAVSTAR